MKPNAVMHEIKLPLDERNLAHILTALSLAGIADTSTVAGDGSRCFWTADHFVLTLPASKDELLLSAHHLITTIRWIAGIGLNDKGNLTASPHHGLFTAEGAEGCNPLLSYHDQGVSSSILKTFSGQLNPAKLLARQQAALKCTTETTDWLFQPGWGVASWKFDCRVSSHALDQGFGSNEDQSGGFDPFYPAIELLAIAGASFFAGSQAWLEDAESLTYCIWREPLPIGLAPLAAANLIEGIGNQKYRLATRGNAYGKGAAYRHFPEATPIQ